MGQSLRKSTMDQKIKDGSVVPIPFSELSPAQQSWVDYNVVQGVIVESDGEMRKVTVQQFADSLGYDRTTLYSWSNKVIPNFWDLVSERRKGIFAGARTAKVWNSVFVAATIKLNVQAQSLWLSNADENFKMPNQQVKHEMGDSWTALMANRKAVQQSSSEPIEGEVVNDEQRIIE